MLCERLKLITISDEATGEVLKVFFTDEPVGDIAAVLNGETHFGVSVFDTKQTYLDSNKEL